MYCHIFHYYWSVQPCANGQLQDVDANGHILCSDFVRLGRGMDRRPALSNLLWPMHSTGRVI